MGLLAVGAFTFTASFGSLWVMKVTVGIRTDAETETAGLDISEHGMFGYPERFIEVPGAEPEDVSGAPTPLPEPTSSPTPAAS